LAASHRAKD